MKNPPTEWRRLDNAAKIFPPTSTKNDPKVFRFACELTEPVVPEVLRAALDRTLKIFPFFRSILHKGMFWYYFEDSQLKPEVLEENLPPCAPLYNKNKKQLLFRVFYYRNRISLEVYHALCDGTGALDFLRVLVYHYLTLKYPRELGSIEPPIDCGASVSQKMDDSFEKYYKRESLKMDKQEWAYRLRGSRLPQSRIRIVEGVLSAKAVLAKAREYHGTMTEFLAAALMCAVHGVMNLRDEKKPVVVTVPVNLRKYFPSESARNFFSVINVGYRFKQAEDFPQVVQKVGEVFKQELTQERLGARMNKLAALEHNYFARAVPLGVKDISLYFANLVAEKQVSVALSNLGRISMPQEFAPYIRLFDVFTSTKKLQLCMCSYQDNLVLSFTSPFVSAEIQRRFFRILTQMGLEIEIVTGTENEEAEDALL